jgi:type III secretion system YopN/LcrE/InvE/MxiC family regulator
MPDPIGVGGFSAQVMTPDQVLDVDDVKFDGKTEGEKVVLEKAAKSLVEQSAVEQSQKLRQTERTLAQRQATGPGAAALAKLLAEYREKLPDLPTADKFDEVLKDLREGDGDAETIRKELERRFPEVAHQQAALAFLEQAISNDRGRGGRRDDDLLREVRSARRDLEEEHGPEIRAALNVSAAAAERPDLGAVGELRDLYRLTVVGYTGISQAYDAIMSRYGAERFPEAVDLLIGSLGRDIASHEPSRDAAELKATLDDLYFVQVARNSIESLNGLIGKMRKQFGLAKDTEPHALMKDLLTLKDQRFIDPERVRSITDRTGARDHESRIYFQRELHALVRRMPDKIFAHADERLKLADAVQAALDRSIAEEGL